MMDVQAGFFTADPTPLLRAIDHAYQEWRLSRRKPPLLCMNERTLLLLYREIEVKPWALELPADSLPAMLCDLPILVMDGLEDGIYLAAEPRRWPPGMEERENRGEWVL